MADVATPDEPSHREKAAGCRLIRTRFECLGGFAGDDHLAAYKAFISSAHAIVDGVMPSRPALPVDLGFVKACQDLVALPAPTSPEGALGFFSNNFDAYHIRNDPMAGAVDGFLTGYYEPIVAGSLEKTAEFSAPILARPRNLVTFDAGQSSLGALSSGMRQPDGSIIPCPNRKSIEAGAIADGTAPLVWLRDYTEVFLIQVQGSARVCLSDGRVLRLAYGGRNGHPYTSIGRALITSGAIKAKEMSLNALKQWIRHSGQLPGEAGRELMNQNESYVFFQVAPFLDTFLGPVAGAGVPLQSLRSIAVDRTLWCYGLPFWIDAILPWQGGDELPFQQLMVAHDTGSAILGRARADIFFGSGDEAGRMAGNIRHRAQMYVLFPKGMDTTWLGVDIGG